MSKRIFCTEDSPEGRKIRTKNEFYLQKHDIPYDDVVYVNSNKVKECIALGADVVIEDNPDTILALAAAGIKVICYPTDYNKHIKSDNKTIFRAKSGWAEDEIYEMVQFLKAEKALHLPSANQRLILERRIG